MSLSVEEGSKGYGVSRHPLPTYEGRTPDIGMSGTYTAKDGTKVIRLHPYLLPLLPPLTLRLGGWCFPFQDFRVGRVMLGRY
jgi:hypothetical protein